MEKTKKMRKEIIEWLVCILIAIFIALVFRYYIATPTIVKQSSMYPTFEENQKLIIQRTFRITKKEPKVGDIITFEAPSKRYSSDMVDQKTPYAIYENSNKGLIEKLSYNVLEINKKSYIKRVIATEGQHVVISNGKVYVDDEELKEDYLNENIKTNSNVFNDFVVPSGYVFAMGDNREHSMDCRELGCIPLEKIEGIVVGKIF